PHPSSLPTDPAQTTDHKAAAEPTDDQTRAGTILGTPAYLAPEQARGEACDARSDVFALGGILCMMLTGTAPYSGDSSVEAIRRARAGRERDARTDEAVATHLDQGEKALQAGNVARAQVALEAARKRFAEGGAEKHAEWLARLQSDLVVLIELDEF